MRKKLFATLLSVLILLSFIGCSQPVGAEAIAELLDQGDKFLQEQNYEQAIVCFNKAIEIEPKNPTAYLGLGSAYEGKGDDENALKSYKAAQAFADGAERDEATNRIINIYINQNEIDKANAEIQNLIDATSIQALLAIFKKLDSERAVASIIALATDDDFLDSIERFKTGGGNISFADEKGFGVDIYKNACVYIGEHSGSDRSGNGSWYYNDGKSFYTGEWANDAPNGQGEIHLNEGDLTASFVRTCELKDGIAVGTIDETAIIAGIEHHWTYNTVDGVVPENENTTCTTCQVVYAVMPGEQIGVYGWIK